MPKVFISGPITGHRFYRVRFWFTAMVLRLKGYKVLNPAILPCWMAHKDAMHVCFGMIDVADVVLFTDGWMDSKGCCIEHDYATAKKKKILYGEP